MQNIFTEEKISSFKSIINSSKKIAIVTHSNPDGDAIGSVAALTLYLRKLYGNKEIRAFAPNSYPTFLEWVANKADIEICTSFDNDKAEYIKSSDLIIASDICSLSRTDHIEEIIKDNLSCRKILIDHHESPDTMDLSFHYSHSSSTCFLIFLLIKYSNGLEDIDTDIANSLFTGFITDTGSFSYSYLTPELFHAAAELIDKGADPVTINQKIFDTQSEDRVKLFGYLISSKMHLIKERNAAYITLSQKEKNQFNYHVGDTEGVVNYPMSISDITTSALFSESNGYIKVSLRSQGKDIDVNKIARQFFNGGGHFNAAGGKFFGTLEEAVKTYYSALNYVPANTFENITTRIRREMNGAVSGTMRNLSKDNQRKINFGVSLPTIKEICSDYSKSHELAIELRKHNVREWWIASVFVDEPSDITSQDADNISKQWVNREESDIFATNLLYLIPSALELAKRWLADSISLRKTAAEKIIMKLAPTITDEEAESFLELTSSELPTRAIYQYHTSLREKIRNNGPYPYSWILDEIDSIQLDTLDNVK